MKVLIIGLGSIARKHISALKQIDPNTHFYALRSSVNSETVENVTNILSPADCPDIDFIIISNPTAFHAEAIKQVIHLKKPLFIEKPPFHTIQQAEECLSLIKQNNIETYTAFNLRFLDSLVYLKKNVDINKVQEVNVYCGSYLPEWRKNVDYKKTYSAKAEMGGGVHLDVIHEIDYVLWIFGLPNNVKSIFKSNSKINIDATDYANYTLIYDTFVVSIILNHYRRDYKRTCEIVLDDASWYTDLSQNIITNVTSNSVIYQSQQTIQDTYKKQMEYFYNCVTTNKTSDNPLIESVNTLKIALS